MKKKISTYSFFFCCPLIFEKGDCDLEKYKEGKETESKPSTEKR